MKYEPVFGDQLAFDGMMPDCEFIVGTYGYKIKDGKCFYCEKYNHKYGWSPTGDAAKALSPVIAMRRIIKDPKRWTWEDKKAGRLPEVGAKCSHCHSVDERTVLSVTDKYVGIERDNSDMNPYFVTHAEFLQYYIPIESPEEKAARLREEWVSKATFMTTYEIYDDLLSGELPVPVKEWWHDTARRVK